MTILQLIYGPNEIFQKIAEPVTDIDQSIRTIVKDMFETMYHEKAIGMGANMVGILKRIVVVDMQENGLLKPYAMINPEITWYSDEKQTYTEASICFPGISAQITRPAIIKVNYLDEYGKAHSIEANNFFATVIQHEIDYLNGVIFLDYLSKIKKEMLLKKMTKHKGKKYD